MGLRIVTLVVSVAVWIGCARDAHASEPPAAERVPTSRSPSGDGAKTLPNAASFGPSRRGDWRVDANVPQAAVAPAPVSRRDEPPPPTTPYRRYAAHPYEGENTGYVLRGSTPSGGPLPGRLHSGQLALEGGQSGPSQGRSSLALRVAFWRLGFDANLEAHFSGLGTQQRPLNNTLVRGSTNGLFALVLQPKVMWWAGGGLNYAGLPAGVRVGPNLTSSVDLFLRRPLVMSARADVGVLGGAPTVAGRGTIGFMLKNFELYAGYEARRLDDLLLQGPMIGGRAWF